MSVVKKLNHELLQQCFLEEERVKLEEYKQAAALYARVENAIAVLSDMRANVSYIYYGKTAEHLDLAQTGTSTVIPSIWEKNILDRLHPDDLQGKHVRELRFFHFLRGIPEKRRGDYYLSSQLRMCDKEGRYVPVLHRIFYVACQSNGSIWLSLCLYSLSTEFQNKHLIIHSADGVIIPLEEEGTHELLSEREKDILRLIQRGKKSKEIASTLSISVNTVSRHRQNILEKLQVGNSVEAVQLAQELGFV